MARDLEITTQVRDGMEEGLNLQEISWCETYLRTMSIKQACIESGLKIEEAGEMCKKSSIIKYLMLRSSEYKLALEQEGLEEIDRQKIIKVLTNIILGPTTTETNRLTAISKLNEMLQFNKINNVGEGNVEESKNISMTAEEAEKLLEQIRRKK